MEIHGVIQSSARIFEMKEVYVICTRRGWRVRRLFVDWDGYDWKTECDNKKVYNCSHMI